MSAMPSPFTLGQCEAVSHAARRLGWLPGHCGPALPCLPVLCLLPRYSPDCTVVIGLHAWLPIGLSSSRAGTQAYLLLKPQPSRGHGT